MMKKYVYNLEFPSWCHTFTIYGYKFTRVEEYPDRVARLQHLASGLAEFNISANTGQHTITAYVELPEQEDKAVLEWADRDGSILSDASALEDIVLLLSIFTGREVFAVNTDNPDDVFVVDPRAYQWGGVLRTSIPYKASHTLDRNSVGWKPPYDIGFEEGINQIYGLIRSDEWQRKYKHGYFLFLARMAFRRQPLESAFTQCWTLWEHLFSVHNSNWLSRDLDAVDRIAFILTEYALTDEIDTKSREQIKSLANIRNNLIHFGRFPADDKGKNKNKISDDAAFFIQLTEFVIAKILGLLPSEIFNTTDKLKAFLRKSPPTA